MNETKILKYTGTADEDETEETINKLLKTLDNDKYEDILELTHSKIKSIKNDILQQLQITRQELKVFHSKLKNYRYIDEVDEIKLGNYIRTIDLKKKDNIYLTSGGIIVDIEAINESIIIKCKNFRNNIFNLKFEEHLIFQKINNQEEILLNILTYINK
tara:strand:+ start:2406 stop:2882 length:477 start_codon:yes stop_codon:yes gene_type:complete